MDRLTELLAAIDASFAEFEDAVSAVPAALVEAPGAGGDWTARQVVAHVGADEQWLAGQLAALRRGQPPTSDECYGPDAGTPPAGIDLATQDGRNAWQARRLAALTVDDARKLLAAGRANLLAELRKLVPAELDRPLTIADHGAVGWIRPPQDDEPAWPLERWISGATLHHHHDHAAQVRAFLVTAGRTQHVRGEG